MSQTLTNHLDLPPAAHHEPVLVEPDLGPLLEQVRANAVRIISDIANPPSAVRVSAGGVTVEVEWNRSDAPAAPPVQHRPAVASTTPVETAPPDTGLALTSPAVGVFYRAPEPGTAPFVVEGDLVAPGTQVGIVEAMKLMIPVTADAAGRIAAVLKGDGEPVEYGEPLFALQSAD